MSLINIEDLNDDIFHIILSFLSFSEVNEIALVSKNNFRMSQLALSDKYHETNYRQKIKHFITLNNYNSYKKFADEVYTSYLKVNADFRMKLLELHSKIDEWINENYYSKQITALNITKKLNFPIIEEIYQPFQEIKTKISNRQIFKQNQKRNLTISFYGDRNVGKTSLASRLHLEMIDYRFNEFENDEDCSTWYVNSKTKHDDIRLILNVDDTLEDGFRRPISFPETDLCCICFDRMKSESFYNIPTRWIPEINQLPDCALLVLVACQVDLLNEQREKERIRYGYFDKITSQEDSIQMARNIGALTYMETSAKTGEGNISDFAEIITKSHALFKEMHSGKATKKCIIC